MAERFKKGTMIQYPGGKAVTADILVADTGGGSVLSVNGKTGAVVLNADDVKARPDTWNPVRKTVIATHGGGSKADMTASEIIDASRNGTVEAEYTDPSTNELRTYQYFKQMPDGRAVFAVNGYIEDGTPKQTLIYVDYAGNVTTETRDATAAGIGAVPVAEKGKANGVASLGSDGKVPTGQLPVIPAKGVHKTVTLSVAGWGGGKTQTVSDAIFAGDAGYDYTIAPAPASAADYSKAGVLCTAVAAGSSTFTCQTTPSKAISVNVRREEAQA